MRRAITILALAVVLTAACSSSEERGPQDTGEAVESTPRQSAPTPTSEPEPSPTPEGFTIGDTVRTAAGNGLVVYSYSAPIDPGFFEPDPGNEYGAIDVEACAGPNPESGSAGINPFNFELQMPDNTRRDAAIAVAEPALHDTTLLANDCVRGFVTFEVPAGVKPRFVIFESSSLIKWAVP